MEKTQNKKTLKKKTQKKVALKDKIRMEMALKKKALKDKIRMEMEQIEIVIVVPESMANIVVRREIDNSYGSGIKIQFNE